MMKDSENAQEFNDLCDDLKDKEDFVDRLKKQWNKLGKQKRMLRDIDEKNHNLVKDAKKHEHQSEFMRKEKLEDQKISEEHK